MMNVLCHLLAEGARNAASWSVVGQEPVFQVDSGLPDEVVSGSAIIVHDLDVQLVIDGERGRDLKHLAKEWIEVVGDVIVFVVDFLLPNFNFQVRVRLEREREWEGIKYGMVQCTDSGN